MSWRARLGLYSEAHVQRDVLDEGLRVELVHRGREWAARFSWERTAPARLLTSCMLWGWPRFLAFIVR